MNKKTEGVSWVGNIFRTFETLCSEVDILQVDMLQEMRKVENQLQSVGTNVKQFCMDFVENVLPQSLEDIAGESASDIDDVNLVIDEDRHENESYNVNHMDCSSSVEPIKVVQLCSSVEQDVDSDIHERSEVGVKEDLVTQKQLQHDISSVDSVVDVFENLVEQNHVEQNQYQHEMSDGVVLKESDSEVNVQYQQEMSDVVAPKEEDSDSVVDVFENLMEQNQYQHEMFDEVELKESDSEVNVQYHHEMSDVVASKEEDSDSVVNAVENLVEQNQYQHLMSDVVSQTEEDSASDDESFVESGEESCVLIESSESEALDTEVTHADASTESNDNSIPSLKPDFADFDEITGEIVDSMEHTLSDLETRQPYNRKKQQKSLFRAMWKKDRQAACRVDLDVESDQQKENNLTASLVILKSESDNEVCDSDWVIV